MDSKTPSYNLSVVVRETGIKPDTLRAWERRYGLPEPVRTEGGHRLYSARDIEMIKWLMARQHEGMRISQAVGLWQNLTEGGIDPIIPRRPRIEIEPIFYNLSDASALAQLRGEWVTACLRFDEFESEYILTQAFARYPVELVVTEVLQRGLAEVGQGWFDGEYSVQQEHFISGLAIRKLNTLISACPGPSRSQRILVGCPPGETHIFSVLVTTLLLRNQGWTVTYLGADVPISDLAKTIQQTQADLVIFSATLLNMAVSLLDVARFIQIHGGRFAYGGRIFSLNPGLRKRIPGYYLGDGLDRIAETVQRIFDGAVEYGSPIEPSAQFSQALAAYDMILEPLNQGILEDFSHQEIDLQIVKMVNKYFSDFIRSGLIFGDLNLIKREVEWVKEFIHNQGTPNELLIEYIKIYRRRIADLIEAEGGILIDWLGLLS